MASMASTAVASPPPAAAAAASPVVLDPRAHSTLSHTLSKVLRHTAPSLGLALDSAGYARVTDLLALPTFRRLTPTPTLQSLQFVAANCPKQRFNVTFDKERQEWIIRANQGHNASFANKIDPEALLVPLQPSGPLPEFCIHGTSRAAWQAIQTSGGLHPMGRSHIHFSAKEFGAADTVSGMRNSSEVLIHLDLARVLQWACAPHAVARNLKLQFFRSANDVLLTPGVVGLGNFLPMFLFERVEEVVGSGRASQKQRRAMPGWIPPTEEQWTAQFGSGVTPPAAAVAAAPSQVVPVSASVSASSSVSLAPPTAATNRWGPPPTSRPPPGWVVPPHLAHIAAAVAADPAYGAAAIAPPAAASKQPFRYLIVLDFEATCDEGNAGPRFGPQEIIEFPMICIDTETGETKAIFHKYCTPQVHPQLTPFCTQLTGITQEMVSPEAGAVPFGTAWAQADAFLREHNLLPSADAPDSSATPGSSFAILTCGDWDLRTALPAQLALLGVKKHEIPAHFCSWINVKTIFNSFYQPVNPARGMLDMLKHKGLTLQGRHHSGLDDCKNIAAVVKRMLDDGCVFKLTQRGKQPKKPTQSPQIESATPAAAAAVAAGTAPVSASRSPEAVPSALQSALQRGLNQPSRFQ